METETDEKQVGISNEIDILKAISEVKKIAQSAGFPGNKKFMITTAVSELARNIYKYAGRGVILVKVLERNGRKGIEIIAQDNGPGIADTDRAMEDHYTTGGGLGLGLPGVKRLMDEFTIASAPGKGTTVTAKKWR